MSSDAPETGVTTAPMAAIDVGSNTTRLLVARADHGQISALASGSAMTALAAGLRPGGTIPMEKLDLVALTVRRMASEARDLGARRVVVACTAPGRMAANASQLLDRLQAAAGVVPRVLSGAEEAELSFRGLLSADAPDPLVADRPRRREHGGDGRHGRAPDLGHLDPDRRARRSPSASSSTTRPTSTCSSR